MREDLEALAQFVGGFIITLIGLGTLCFRLAFGMPWSFWDVAFVVLALWGGAPNMIIGFLRLTQDDGD